MGLCPTMAPPTPFVQRPSFARRINQLPARKNWPCLVEAALYRDTGGRIVMQPRVLTRTEVVRRVVFEGGRLEDLAAEDEPAEDGDGDTAAYHDEPENVRFWTAVFDDYRFSDVTVELPENRRSRRVFVKVARSGFRDRGLSFWGFLDRGGSNVSCYLACRKNIQPGVAVFREVERSLDELRRELGDDLKQWDRHGRAQIGFRRPTQFPFPPEGVPAGEFEDAVAWMRESLDRLVSTIHPRLQRMISARS